MGKYLVGAILSWGNLVERFQEFLMIDAITVCVPIWMVKIFHGIYVIDEKNCLVVSSSAASLEFLSPMIMS